VSLRALWRAANATTDRSLAEVLARLEAAFPDRVRSFYLSGSVVDLTSVGTSDIDGLVLLKDSATEEEHARFADVVRECSLSHRVLFDFALRGEMELLAEGELPAKKAARVLLAGEDIRDRIPEMPVEQYARLTMRGSLFYLRHMRGSQAPLRRPLTYPDADGEFFGYERDGLRGLHGWSGSGTKALLGGLTLAATTLVAIQAGVGVASRRESVLAYSALVGGEWSAFLLEVYARCRGEWGYLIPESSADRAQLREMCRRVVAFENHYVSVSREYLCRQVAQGGNAQLAELLAQLG